MENLKMELEAAELGIELLQEAIDKAEGNKKAGLEARMPAAVARRNRLAAAIR